MRSPPDSGGVLLLLQDCSNWITLGVSAFQHCPFLFTGDMYGDVAAIEHLRLC